MATDLTPPETESTQAAESTQGIIQSQLTPAETLAAPEVYEPQAYEASDDELVSAQVARLLGENSSYLQLSRTQAEQAAHARGLSNTALAAGWGQSAAIESALPIAQQDAGYYQNRGLADQQGIISSYLQQQQGSIDSALQNQGTVDQAYLYGQQAEYESQLQTQIDNAKLVLQSEAATQQEKLQAQIDLAAAERQAADIASQKDLLLTDIEANKALQAQQDAAYMERLQVEISARSDLQAEQNAAEDKRQEIELAAQQKMAELEFDQATQVQVTESLGTLSQQYQREVAEILTNTALTTAADRNKALTIAAETYQASVDLLVSLSGVDIEWSTGTTSSSGTTSSGTTSSASSGTSSSTSSSTSSGTTSSGTTSSGRKFVLTPYESDA
jgi:hypothetical protein